MTRPMSEPSHLKRTGEMQKAVRQLQRRPGAFVGTSYAYCFGGGSQIISATAECEFDNFVTNDPETFTAVDGSAMLLTGDGLFAGFSTIEVFGGYIGVSRSAYMQVQHTSAYPTFGNEFGFPFVSFDSSLLDTTNVRVANYGFGSYTADPDDPWRITLVGTYSGANYQISNASMLFWRIGDNSGTTFIDMTALP
jgi:hypothetical protein